MGGREWAVIGSVDALQDKRVQVRRQPTALVSR
jgi:hypothetical protein